MNAVDLRARAGPVLAAVVVVVVLVGVALQLSASATEVAELTVGDRVAPLTFGLFAVVAGVLTARRPDLVVGWLLLGFAGLMALNGATTGLAHRLSDPGGELAAWLQSWTWLPAITLLAIALLHFPDGCLPSRRWRHLLWLQVGGMVLAVVLAVALWPDRGPALLDPEAPWPGSAAAIGGAAMAVMGVGFFGALVSLLLRWRSASTLVRLQLKWLLLAVAALVMALVLAAISDLAGHGDQWWQDLFGVSGLFLLPVAIGAAVLRYRLFEIDRIISRTVAWLVLSVLSAAVYVGGVLGLGALLPADGGDGVVALSTLAVAALFQPLRGRVQRVVDRRFDRARYDAVRTIDAFGRGLRDQVSRDAVIDALRRTAAETFGTAAVGLVVVGDEAT